MRILSLAMAVPVLACVASAQETGQTRGWIEHARILPHGLLLEAKLDSGARTTSIHAEILDPDTVVEEAPAEMTSTMMADTEADAAARMAGMVVNGLVPDDPPEGQVTPVAEAAMPDAMPDTITFRVTNSNGTDIVLRRPIVRWVDIRRRGGGTIRRPVVRLEICIAGLRTEGEVNLADRTGFNYPLLVGRNMLGDTQILVDARQMHVADMACPSKG